MRRMLALVVVGLAAAVAALAGPGANVAFACSCGSVVPARDLPRFDAAFVGRPVAHRIDRPGVLWRFEIERPVKGVLHDPLAVRAPLGGGACGLELHAQDRIGLLLMWENGAYESALCYKTDPDVLARYASPTARVLGPVRDDAGGWPWWPFVVAAGALITLAFGLLSIRRRA